MGFLIFNSISDKVVLYEYVFMENALFVCINILSYNLVSVM